MLKIVEVFNSVQGEGKFLGCPCTFIRLAGCNKVCSFCDTDWVQYTEKSVAEIRELVNNPFVVITGGEPTLQDLRPLLEALKQDGKFVAIETNGTYPVKKEYGDLISWISCSPKYDDGYKIVEGCSPNELKYVVDEHFFVGKIPLEYMNENRPEWNVPIWLQPQGFDMEASAKRAYEIVTQDKYVGRLRLGIQMHKLLNLK